MKPKITVVMATYNRAHLLWRSILGYNRCRFPLDGFELVVVDDGSEDETEAVVNRIDTRVNLVYVKLRKEPGLWRDVAAVINVGLRAAAGEVVAAVHPEMVPGVDSLTGLVENAKPGVYVNCVPYYLSPEDQDNLDSVDWLASNTAVRRLPNFYAPRDGHPDYHPSAIDRVGKPGGHPHWLSWVFAAMHRKTWSHMGGFIESPVWGACDLLFVQRRNRLGIATVTLTGDEEIVLHQNHCRPFGKFVPTNRDINAAHAAAPALTVDECRFPAVDHLWGPYP